MLPLESSLVAMGSVSHVSYTVQYSDVCYARRIAELMVGELL